MSINTNWIQWDGKRSAPVFTAGPWVSLEFRDGHVLQVQDPWNWDWAPQMDEARDIVAYKVWALTMPDWL